MKKYTFALFQILAFSCLLFTFASCEKDEGKLPSIEFKTGATYTSADKTVAKGEAVLVGIKAAKTEDKDVLKTFNVSVSYDGAAANTTVNQALTGSQGDNYEVDVPIIARNQDGTEKYTFTVVNRDGLVNSVTLTLTVQ
jgi:hypothetical protein